MKHFKKLQGKHRLVLKSYHCSASKACHTVILWVNVCVPVHVYSNPGFQPEIFFMKNNVLFLMFICPLILHIQLV